MAQLNYNLEQDAVNIGEMEMHPDSDEAFLLLSGKAFLITGEEPFNETDMVWLEADCTYNVPAGIWHNIAMQKGASVLIVENANVHLQPPNKKKLPSSAMQQIKEFERRG